MVRVVAALSLAATYDVAYNVSMFKAPLSVDLLVIARCQPEQGSLRETLMKASNALADAERDEASASTSDPDVYVIFGSDGTFLGTAMTATEATGRLREGDRMARYAPAIALVHAARTHRVEREESASLLATATRLLLAARPILAVVVKGLGKGAKDTHAPATLRAVDDFLKQN